MIFWSNCLLCSLLQNSFLSVSLLPWWHYSALLCDCKGAKKMLPRLCFLFVFGRVSRNLISRQKHKSNVLFYDFTGKGWGEARESDWSRIPGWNLGGSRGFLTVDGKFPPVTWILLTSDVQIQEPGHFHTQDHFTTEKCQLFRRVSSTLLIE